jgi:hypothetical protein
MKAPLYSIDFYKAADGDCPVQRWLDGLELSERGVLGLAMLHLLQAQGPDLVGTRWAKSLKDGLYEFRVDTSVKELLSRLGLKPKAKLRGASARGFMFRVFFCMKGKRLIIVLGGYDKQKRTSPRFQQEQIQVARERLEDLTRRGK